MLIRSDRRHHFDVPRDEVWSALCCVDDYRTWWPWLRSFDGNAVVAGAVWNCTVRPSLPYVVRFGVEIVEVEESSTVRAVIEGDIEGAARIDLTDDPTGCSARLRAELAPASRLLQGFALIARPVVVRGHDEVLDRGVDQFRRHLDRVGDATLS